MESPERKPEPHAPPTMAQSQTGHLLVADFRLVWQSVLVWRVLGRTLCVGAAVCAAIWRGTHTTALAALLPVAVFALLWMIEERYAGVRFRVIRSSLSVLDQTLLGPASRAALSEAVDQNNAPWRARSTRDVVLGRGMRKYEPPVWLGVIAVVYWLRALG